MPVVLLMSAWEPIAVFQLAVLFKSASSPRTVLKFVKQPSWQVAGACGASARQTKASGMNIRVGVFITPPIVAKLTR